MINKQDSTTRDTKEVMESSNGRTMEMYPDAEKHGTWNVKKSSHAEKLCLQRTLKERTVLKEL